MSTRSKCLNLVDRNPEGAQQQMAPSDPAGAVLNRDAPAYALWAGVPARQINTLDRPDAQ